ncbi:MAG: Sulfotransferase, partial [uncultured Rubrobacteraceae bacterium]
APHSRVPRGRRGRRRLGPDLRVLLLRLDEAERRQERPPRWSLLGRWRPGLYQPGNQRPVDGDPDAEGRQRVRRQGRPGARTRVRAVAGDGRGAL